MEWTEPEAIVMQRLVKPIFPRPYRVVFAVLWLAAFGFGLSRMPNPSGVPVVMSCIGVLCAASLVQKIRLHGAKRHLTDVTGAARTVLLDGEGVTIREAGAERRFAYGALKGYYFMPLKLPLAAAYRLIIFVANEKSKNDSAVLPLTLDEADVKKFLSGKLKLLH